LVIMTTHGRTGVTRFALGSTADRLVREGIAPVLLARPFTPSDTALETALVPLDGSAVAEAALSMVEHLALKPLRTVRLLRAISANDERTGAVGYLERAAEPLRTLGLRVQTDVVQGTPARAIAYAAGDADLVILSTHGRGGLDRLRHGSVAEQATRHLATPTLLVRSRQAVKPPVDVAPTAVAV
jgi:nucleotide-binding universal stress UspA family protein